MMKNNRNRATGHHYEQQACHYLIEQGLQPIGQNVYCRGGEIDLIMLDQQTLVFIEVKFRQDLNFGHPAEFVTPAKQKRLQKCAQFYLLKQPQLAKYPMRFDLIAITQTPAKVDWIKNAFGGW
jgi:putative endonuclease